MNKLIEVLIGVVVLVAGGFIALQFKSFKQWLVYAVCEAENYFGSKTGQLKLQYVYNIAATSKFSFITKIVTFNMFSKFVDAALVKMRTMIENNEKIADILTKANVVDVTDEEE